MLLLLLLLCVRCSGDLRHMVCKGAATAGLLLVLLVTDVDRSLVVLAFFSLQLVVVMVVLCFFRSWF